MKKIFLAITIAAAALGANAQILWKVSGGNAKGDSYLFGTHHVAPYTMMDSVAGFNDALKSVDAIIGEIDMQNTDMTAMQQATMARAMAPADSTIMTLLSPEQLDSLTTVLGKYTGGQLTAQAMAPMKPAMITTTIAMMQTMAIFPDFDQSKQLDAMAQQRAHNAGKAIGAFETIEEQLDFLLGAPLQEQAAQLIETVRHDSESAEMARELATAYLTQDLDKISTIMNSQDDTSELMERLISGRNAAWAEKLAAMLPQSNVLVVVGCGHLPGDKGLIGLLRSKGYEVTPVK